MVYYALNCDSFTEFSAYNFMIFASSRFKNMYVPFGLGVAMNAQTDIKVVIFALMKTAVLFIYGNSCFSYYFHDSRIDCSEAYRNYRSATDYVVVEMVRRSISYHAPQCGDNVDNYGTI